MTQQVPTTNNGNINSNDNEDVPLVVAKKKSNQPLLYYSIDFVSQQQVYRRQYLVPVFVETTYYQVEIQNMVTPPTNLQGQIIFKVVGSISCLGSGYIIQDVLRHPDKRSKSVYHRIMVGLSAMDIFYSFSWYVLGSWPMPKGSWLWAAGNMASCDAAAFIGTFGYIGSSLYNCSLATYYSLQLKYNWQDHRIKRIQKWFHIVPCSISLLLCTIALCTKTIGPYEGYCA